jgi:drug/metabolite transporter (DMT)-like permease
MDDSGNSASPIQALIGVMLVLVGSALNSCQNVFEEKLLKVTGSASVDPLEVVGWEGVSGTFFSSFVLLPAAQAIPGNDCGTAESTTDSLLQMSNSGLIVGFLIGYALSLALMNYFSQVISKHLSAVHRMLVSTLRTIFVWIVSLILFYTSSGEYGESWSVTSWMQLGGFILLIAGTYVYGIKPAAKRSQELLNDPTLTPASGESESLRVPLSDGNGLIITDDETPTRN